MGDFIRQVVSGDLSFQGHTMCGTNRATHHRQSVASHQRHREAKQGSARLSQSWQLTVQRLGEQLQMGFDRPTHKIEGRDHLSRYFIRQVGQDGDGPVAIAGLLQ
jgi:hypothetical protein